MADKFPFELVTPNRLLVSEDVDMVVVPGGVFWMGSPPEEVERDEQEGPVREVVVTGMVFPASLSEIGPTVLF